MSQREVPRREPTMACYPGMELPERPRRAIPCPMCGYVPTGFIDAMVHGIDHFRDFDTRKPKHA
jgi:hypothetical protein